MTNVEASAPATEEAVPLQTQDTPEVETELEGGEGTEGEETTNPAPDDDEEELEWDGKKFRAPKGVKDGLLMHADYTRKTQEIAELRKAAEAEIAQAKATNQETLKDLGRAALLDERLEQWSKVNWSKWSDEDPIEASKAWMRYQAERDERTQIDTRIETRNREALERQRSEAAKLIEEGQRVLAREIKGWNADVAREVATFGISQGLTREEVSGINDPRLVKILHAAMVGSKILKSQQSKPAATPSATPAPVPVAQKVGKAAPASVSKLSDRASIDDWMKAREAQIRARG